MKKIIIIMIALYVLACNNPFKKTTNLVFYNDSQLEIGLTLPDDVGRGNKDADVDSTLASFRKWSDSYTSFCPLEGRMFRIRLESFEEWIPRKSNYIPFFIFDFSTMENAGANTVGFYNKDEYLVRYDLTLSNIHTLLNNDGALELHFPPDERMKDIHMYPPYEEVIAKYSN